MKPVRVSPNPVLSGTTISYSLPRAGEVDCAVYDAAGNLVARLADGVQPAGEHSLAWNAAGVRPGVYLLKLSGTASHSARIIKLAD